MINISQFILVFRWVMDWSGALATWSIWYYLATLSHMSDIHPSNSGLIQDNAYIIMQLNNRSFRFIHGLV